MSSFQQTSRNLQLLVLLLSNPVEARDSPVLPGDFFLFAIIIITASHISALFPRFQEDARGEVGF